jgi:hypothetical protein
MEYYSAIKKNEAVSLARKWIKLKIMMSKRNQAQNTKYSIFLLSL